jgi:23S rRNA (adenine1618-N6)-methyltransferase
MPNINMHPRNLHKHGYNFAELSSTLPKLKSFLITTPLGTTSINFSDPLAVKTLNAALLAHFYHVNNWNIPADHLCPPVPGRADYIHHIADLLAEDKVQQKGDSITGLDIGVGANLIYPILGSQIYGWRFVGSELNADSIKSARAIVKHNPQLSKLITLRQQTDISSIFDEIINPKDQFDFSMCNPPFHASQEDAEAGSQRKNKNLARNKQKRQNQKASKDDDEKKLNFAGKSNELWCEGGELAFIKRMINESRAYSLQVKWFTSLVSKKDNLKSIYRHLEHIKVKQVKTITMGQGQKTSRFVAWSY